MENVDTCVCCGNIIPEGRMVCHKCSGTEHNTSYKQRPTSNDYENLRWHQKLALKLYYVLLKQLSRKGLHRYL